MIIYVCYSLLLNVDDEQRKKRVEKLNSLYLQQNEIHVWVEDESLLLNEVLDKLESWKCKFKYVKSKKPFYDILIDDNTTKSNLFFNYS